MTYSPTINTVFLPAGKFQPVNCFIFSLQQLPEVLSRIFTIVITEVIMRRFIVNLPTYYNRIIEACCLASCSNVLPSELATSISGCLAVSHTGDVFHKEFFGSCRFIIMIHTHLFARNSNQCRHYRQ